MTKYSRTLIATIVAATLPAAALAYTQAPMLASDAKLPPVDKRLPDKPLVIKPIQANGVYGGTLRTVVRATGDQNGILRTIGNQGLTHWTQDGNGVEPYVAESYTVSADASEYTFHLRKGMKWSDGAPFTADDIVFAMNDLILNKEFFGQTLDMYMVGGKAPEVTKVDDFTVKFKFAAPYLTFPEWLAAPYGQHQVLYAKHYCQQFHPKYNKNVSELFAKNNVKDWPTLMRAKCADTEVPSRWATPERPTLDPWIVKEPYGGTAQRVLMERNPYYWQVDPSGKQLPYIDRVQFAVISDVQAALLQATNGQFDFEGRMFVDVTNRPVLLKNQQKGGYKVFGQVSTNANAAGLWLNQTTKNDKLRPFITNHDFRAALSHAMDREEINKVVYYGLASPWQSGPFKESKWYNEKLGTQYLKHDVDTANKMLDALGLTKRDSDGYREYPNGGRVQLEAIVMIDRTHMIATLELIRRQWKRVGVELTINAAERSLATNRAVNNDYDVSIDVFPGGLDATLAPRAYVANYPLESRQSLEWVKWYLTQGKQGVEPSPSMKKRMALYDQWRSAKTPAEADKLFREVLQIAADEFEVIGTVRPAPVTTIRSLKLQNVNEKAPFSWPLGSPALSLPQQWWFKN
ncbi:ABC transporter substrate-binding protein [Uliginosibacterium sp. sgz301328]|uniref:ABC transporter substrate-binding protein n=1 Tax=Uliginosibacterium sp. sgz301328 TaxID=3243764 RepID=UPI00359E86A6